MDFITHSPTPILNTPHFKKVYGERLPFDDQELVREVEMIALPGMVFEVIQEEKEGILQVKTDDYPSASSLYLDARAGEKALSIKKRKVELPSVEMILSRMVSKVGTPYVWGGNYSAGIPEWAEWYPPKDMLTSFEEAHWLFKGVDCSGLLFEATNGFTPRNTSWLMKYGIEIALTDVKPLDLILYPGHVIIVLDENEVIESNHEKGGVLISPLEQRISEIKKPMMVRRFHPASFQTP
ncbi:MAG: C40 family peptidase [Chlamydiales bacterium]|nr:C40 family peptidase [Chlamydiales bacterium]